MHEPEWLKGGPFLEISFLVELGEEKKETVQDIIMNLSKVRSKIEIYDKNVGEMLDLFDRGYPCDEKDPQSSYMHSLQLRVYVSLSRKRRATLQIERVSSNAVLVNFWFFGSIFDASEWAQIGIKKEEMPDFTNFLKQLYSVYEFKIGGMAIEQDVLELLGLDETYPNECYRFENMVPERLLLDSSHFIEIIWNEKYEKLSSVPYKHTKLEKEGNLITIGSFHDLSC
ncbi:hypothetical protein NCCP2222_39460 [Sporosarcina sp. NCCP-2222]|uniref:hypothetical protein n=1 Tax=Sporosarcina sp. NCCP-2222 TaxID=2935073 RepID=UPI0020895D16|nr:hypothetical protein [Sporosarcina sp. NCCP-2222]GKV57999.1 hypothetical protein NCCP2222_39460 [Sporosarcina sp. NCCP-2222]